MIVAADGTIAAVRRAWKDVGAEAVTPRLVIAMILVGAGLGGFFGGLLTAIQIPGYGWIIGVSVGAVVIAGVTVYTVRHGRRDREQREAEQQRADTLWRFGSREPSPIPSERMSELRELGATERPTLLGSAVGQALAGCASIVVAVTVFLFFENGHFAIGSLVGSTLGFSLVPAVRLARAQRLYERTEPGDVTA